MSLLIVLPLPTAFLQQPLTVLKGRRYLPLICLSLLDVYVLFQRNPKFGIIKKLSFFVKLLGSRKYLKIIKIISLKD
jgi:hypothetical protein